jgi:hypothetical protein
MKTITVALITLTYIEFILSAELCNLEEYNSCLKVWSALPNTQRTPFATCFCHGKLVDLDGCKINGNDCQENIKEACQVFCKSSPRGLCTGVGTCIIDN